MDSLQSHDSSAADLISDVFLDTTKKVAESYIIAFSCCTSAGDSHTRWAPSGAAAPQRPVKGEPQV